MDFIPSLKPPSTQTSIVLYQNPSFQALKLIAFYTKFQATWVSTQSQAPNLPSFKDFIPNPKLPVPKLKWFYTESQAEISSSKDFLPNPNLQCIYNKYQAHMLLSSKGFIPRSKLQGFYTKSQAKRVYSKSGAPKLPSF